MDEKPKRPQLRIEHTFEYCVVRAFFLWKKDESKLHEELKKDDPPLKALRDAIGHFQVSRKFSDIGKPQAATRIQKAISAIDDDGTQCPEKVMKLAKQFEKDFGQLNISAASKLLWLRHRKPYVIYDGRTVSALKRRYPFEKANYPDYWWAWHAAYEEEKSALKATALRLAKLQPFPESRGESDTLSALAKSPWFLERVFDTYLWEVGGTPRELRPAAYR